MRFLKKFLRVSLALCVLAFAVILYLNNVFLPVQAKAILIDKAQSALNRDVSLDRIFFDATRGFVFTSLTIHNIHPDPTPLLTVDELSVSLPVPGLVWTGPLHIPAIALKQPRVHIKSDAEGNWDFLDIPALKFSQKPDSSTLARSRAPLVSIGRIEIINGAIFAANPEIYETITQINATAKMDLLRNIQFETELAIPQYPTTLNAAGQFSIKNNELAAKIKTKNANIPPILDLLGIPLWVKFHDCFLRVAALDLTFKEGELTLEGLLDGRVNLTTTALDPHVFVQTDIDTKNFVFKRKGNQFHLKGSFQSQGTQVVINNDKEFWGAIRSESITLDRDGNRLRLTGTIQGENTRALIPGIEFSGNPVVHSLLFERHGKNLRASGKARIEKAAFKNNDSDLRAADVTGHFEINRETPDLNLKISAMSAQKIVGLYKNNAISGHVNTEFLDLTISNNILNINGNFQAQDFRAALSRNFVLSGSPQLSLTLTRNMDPLMEERQTKYSGTLILNRDTLSGVPKINALTELSGKIDFNNSGAETKNLLTVANGSSWDLSGKLQNFREPTLSLQARSPEVDLGILKDLYPKTSRPINASIEGAAKNVLVTMEGTLFRKEPPRFKVSGDLNNATIKAERLPEAFTNVTGSVEIFEQTVIWNRMQATYKGLNLTTSGSLNNFESPEFSFDVSGPRFTAFSKARFSDRILTVSRIKGEFRENPFDLEGSINLREKIPAWTFKGSLSGGEMTTQMNLDPSNAFTSDLDLKLTNLDLSQIKKTFPALENKALAGQMSVQGNMNGPLNEPSRWKGTAAITIKDGRILEIEVLKGIWKTLFSGLLVDEYKHIAFQEAAGNFTIEGGRVQTNDLLLKSPSVDLSAKGWAAFDSTVNFDVIADVRQIPLATATAVKAAPSAIVSQFAKNVVGFKVTGTLSQPKTRYKILPWKVIKKTTNSVFLGIQGMMEDLLQQ